MLPSGWSQKESKSRKGVLYYVNKSTGETQWELPTEPVSEKKHKAVQEVRVRHILKKHAGSRRPSSWRCPRVTQSKEEAIEQIRTIKQRLESALEREGYESMASLFATIAEVESDCSSAQKGGDLGMFGEGAMQKAFEEASFSLAVGGLSDFVDSDSGIHIILRIE